MDEIEQRLARIEDSLAKAHRTGIEVGAAAAVIPAIICSALPRDALLRVEEQLEQAIAQAGKQPSTRVVLEHALMLIRRQARPARA